MLLTPDRRDAILAAHPQFFEALQADPSHAERSVRGYMPELVQRLRSGELSEEEITAGLLGPIALGDSRASAGNNALRAAALAYAASHGA